MVAVQKSCLMVSPRDVTEDLYHYLVNRNDVADDENNDHGPPPASYWSFQQLLGTYWLSSGEESIRK